MIFLFLQREWNPKTINNSLLLDLILAVFGFLKRMREYFNRLKCGLYVSSAEWILNSLRDVLHIWSCTRVFWMHTCILCLNCNRRLRGTTFLNKILGVIADFQITKYRAVPRDLFWDHVVVRPVHKALNYRTFALGGAVGIKSKYLLVWVALRYTNNNVSWSIDCASCVKKGNGLTLGYDDGSSTVNLMLKLTALRWSWKTWMSFIFKQALESSTYCFHNRGLTGDVSNTISSTSSH